ncbi:MAG TPA: TIGR00730 family Rossman fold protein [Acidobacteriota bacterium]|nr:TIGR00730 family Rossman fold protein [Acidobacteriota bacterium]
MTDREDQKPEPRWWDTSSAYRKANEDIEFLNRDELRPVRLQLELLKPELTLQKRRIRSTIVVFGGTRIVEPAEARRRLAALAQESAAKPDDQVLARRLAAAHRVVEKSRFYDEARRFGALVSQANDKDDAHDFVIMTGGGPGIMEAANRGAWDVGAESIGLNITLPHEQEPNRYITPELCFQFRYFAIRKMHFLLRARALVAFPGGYGTMDELFEALTLVQTQKIDPLPIVLMDRAFWDGAIHFDHLVDEGVIDPGDINLFHYAETAQEAWDWIREFWNNGG